MTKEELREALRSYKMDVARRDVLAIELKKLQRMAEMAHDVAVEECVLPGRGLSGMPGSGRVSKKVEDVALKLADGEMPERVQDWMAERGSCSGKLAILNEKVGRIEAAMGALREREHAVIRLHEMEGVSWRELEDRSRKEMGEHISGGTLRRIRDAAMDKMLLILNGGCRQELGKK